MALPTHQAALTLMGKCVVPSLSRAGPAADSGPTSASPGRSGIRGTRRAQSLRSHEAGRNFRPTHAR